MAREPWSRAAAIFLPLGVALAAADASPARPHRGGWVLVASGLALALFGSAAGLEALGRLAIPLAVVGMAAAVGHPAPRVAGIALFGVPPPFTLVALASPGAERALARIAVDVGTALGAGWSLGNATIRTAGGDLRLGGADLGVPLAHLLAGLGYCAGVVRGDDWLRCAGRGLRWALSAIPGQVLFLALALALLAGFGAAAARSCLDLLPILVGAALAAGLLRVTRPGAGGRSESMFRARVQQKN